MSQTSTAPGPAAGGASPDGDAGGQDALDVASRTPAEIGGALEALLMLAEEPLRTADLAATVGEPESVVADCLAELVAFYDETGRGFELRQVGGGWRYYTREEHAELVAASVLEGQQAKLSQAALETLAVVAYTQPISRGRVSAVRGVNVDGVVRTLLARGLIEESGQDPESGAVVFTTTSYFLERMGLRSLDDLPPLAPHLPEVDALEAELGQLGSLAPDPVAPLAAPDGPGPDGPGPDDPHDTDPHEPGTSADRAPSTPPTHHGQEDLT